METLHVSGEIQADPIVSPQALSRSMTYKKSINSPVNPETGSLVDPQDLPKYLRTHEWTRPECLCILRGFKRTTTLLTPKRPESRAYGAICLVCPESECPYFGATFFSFLGLYCIDRATVNLDELFRDHTDDILFANSCMSDSGDDGTLDKRREYRANFDLFPSFRHTTNRFREKAAAH